MKPVSERWTRNSEFAHRESSAHARCYPIVLTNLSSLGLSPLRRRYDVDLFDVNVGLMCGTKGCDTLASLGIYL